MPPALYYYGVKIGSAAANITRRGEQSTAQNSTVSQRGSISAAVWLCDELPYASHEIICDLRFKFKREVPSKISKLNLRF